MAADRWYKPICQFRTFSRRFSALLPLEEEQPTDNSLHQQDKGPVCRGL